MVESSVWSGPDSLPPVPFAVARGASEFEFGRDGVSRGFVFGDVIEVEEIAATAIGAVLIARFDQSFLAAVGVTAPVGGIDRVLLAVDDECTDERLFDEPRDD